MSLIVLVISAGVASASTCYGDALTLTYSFDRAYWGIENRINLPRNAVIYGSYNTSQILDFLGVLDARVNLPSFSGCFNSDCQMQVGNIKGTIGRSNGTFTAATTSFRPYVEEYDKNGFSVNTYFSWGAGFSNFYDVFDTGQVDPSGFHLLSAYFNNNAGSGTVLIGQGWYLQGSNFQITGQAEMNGNFSGAAATCPLIDNEEFGTYGYGTHIDYYSAISRLRLSDRSWQNWTGGITQADFPYHHDYFIPTEAWNVWGS